MGIEGEMSMKMSSKKTMLTAAVLVALSSGTTFAATPGTVDSQELFHANRLVTDPGKQRGGSL